MGRMNWNLLSEYRGQIYGFIMIWIMFFHLDYVGDIKLFSGLAEEFFSLGNGGVDVFLFLSGMSQYYSLKKKPDILRFYGKRFWKIGKIYVFFCIPFLLLFYGYFVPNQAMLYEQLTLQKKNLSSFWFIICIAVCYLIFPMVFLLIESGREKWILVMIGLWSVLILLAAYFFHDSFVMREIAYTRLPAFLLGCYCAPKVYEHRTVHPAVPVALAGFLLFGGIAVDLLWENVQVADCMIIVQRYVTACYAYFVMMVVTVFCQYIEETAMFRFLGWCGEITLELYVVHIAMRKILIEGLQLQPTAFFEVPVIIGLTIAASFLLAVILNLVLSPGKFLFS